MTGYETFSSIATKSWTGISTAPIDTTETCRTLRVRETFWPTAQLSRAGETGQTDADGRSRWRHLAFAVDLAR